MGERKVVGVDLWMTEPLPSWPKEVLRRATESKRTWPGKCPRPYGKCGCRTHEKLGWIYFVQGDDGGPIKIGFSVRPELRVSEIQGGYPFGGLRVVGLKFGHISEERRLHKNFATDRLFGEWFRPSLGVLAEIRGLNQAEVG